MQQNKAEMCLCCITAGFTRDCCSEVDILVMECEMQQPQCHSPARLSQATLTAAVSWVAVRYPWVKLELLSCTFRQNGA